MSKRVRVALALGAALACWAASTQATVNACPPSNGFYNPVTGVTVTIDFEAVGECSQEPPAISPLCGKGSGACIKATVHVRIRNGSTCDLVRYRCGDSDEPMTMTCDDQTITIDTAADQDWGDQLTGCGITVCVGSNCDDGT